MARLNTGKTYHSWINAKKIIHYKGDFLTTKEHDDKIMATHVKGYKGVSGLSLIFDSDYIQICNNCKVWKSDITGQAQEMIRVYAYYKNKIDFISDKVISRYKAPNCKGDKDV